MPIYSHDDTNPCDWTPRGAVPASGNRYHGRRGLGERGWASNVGIRGEIRYFHAFKDLELAGITLSDTKLDFGRAAAALVLKF